MTQFNFKHSDIRIRTTAYNPQCVLKKEKKQTKKKERKEERCRKTYQFNSLLSCLFSTKSDKSISSI